MVKTIWLTLLCLQSWTWAADLVAAPPPPKVQTLDFGLFWPPKDPADAATATVEPLLSGRLTVRQEDLPDRGTALRLRITLNRSSDEPARERWNARLAFPEYAWMAYVRVWDSEHRWLWPNLPYLLRLHGRERIDRYGGVDPGKGVDNDFAAVLIRKYSVDGDVETEVAPKAPLVSAEWYPVGTTNVNKQTIMHSAQSDEFTLHAGHAGEPPQGRAKVWLIYADFMDAKAPRSWPKTPEFAGGILGYFEIEWQAKPGAALAVNLRQGVPKQSTGFDWESWSTRALASPNPKSAATLSDPSSKAVSQRAAQKESGPTE